MLLWIERLQNQTGIVKLKVFKFILKIKLIALAKSLDAVGHGITVYKQEASGFLQTFSCVQVTEKRLEILSILQLVVLIDFSDNRPAQIRQLLRCDQGDGALEFIGVICDEITLVMINAGQFQDAAAQRVILLEIVQIVKKIADTAAELLLFQKGEKRGVGCIVLKFLMLQIQKNNNVMAVKDRGYGVWEKFGQAVGYLGAGGCIAELQGIDYQKAKAAVNV